MADDILIVDDEADIRELVSGILQDEGFITRSARDSDDALAHVASRRPNLVFLDIWLQGSRLDGLQLLDAMKAQHPELPIVMISGHGNIETAVAAIKQGAYDFIEKPFKADRLVLVADRALENLRLKREVRAFKQMSPSTLVGRSAVMNQLRQTVDKVAPTNSRILIVGPSGSGKELAARALHAQSGRAEGPFVVINAAAIANGPSAIEHVCFRRAFGRKAISQLCSLIFEHNERNVVFFGMLGNGSCVVLTITVNPDEENAFRFIILDQCREDWQVGITDRTFGAKE